jgi:hypothetical protein
MADAQNQAPVDLQQVLDQINALQGQLATLQAKNADLMNQVQGLQQAAAAPQGQGVPPPVGGGQVQPGAPPSFALTPATTDLVGLIDYSSKLGQSIYKQGCKKLTKDDGFAMTPATTVAFVKAFKNRCTVIGWNQGDQNITKFMNQNGVTVDVIKNYSQINEANLCTGCKVFWKVGCAKVHQSAAKNNHMMAQCLKKSLTVASLVRLEPYQSQYLFNGVEYGPLMYKIIMRLATIDSVAMTEALRANLNNLPIYAASMNGDINLIKSYFNVNYSQILARVSTINNAIAKLFDAYLVMPDYNFKQNIAKKQDDYHDGNLGANFTHKNLMAQATAKFTYLTTRKIWGSKSPDEECLIAMIADLKGKLKLAPALADKRKMGGNKRDVREGQVKKKNKKNTSNKTHQKKEEAWRKLPPKDGEPTTKEVASKKYQWCIHHMAWGVHSAQECCLGTSPTDTLVDKPKDKAKAMTYAAAVATIANPSFAAFLSELSDNKK